MCTREARALRSSTAGRRFPTTQTTTAVQIDEILTALQSDTRANLQRALKGYGEALNAVPTAAEDATQDPDVQGLTGAQAINKTFRYGGKAGRTSAIVNQAFLGQHPHDLSGLIRAQRDLFAKLASTDGALSDLITNFNITAGAFASESANLSASIRELAPTLQAAEPSLRHLNDALPWARRLARESLPGIRELPATIRAGSPWLVQTGRLLRQSELGGTARLLAASAPGLARAGHASLKLFPQVGLVQPLRLGEPGPGRQRRDRRRGAATRSAPASRTSASSSTASPSWRARARASTATGPSFASRPAAGLSSCGWPTPRAAPGETEHRPGRTTSRRRSATRPRLPVGPTGRTSAAVPDGRSLPHAGRARHQRPRRRRRPPEPGGGAVRRAIREHLRDFVAIGVLRRHGADHHRDHPGVADDPAPRLDPPHRGRQVRAQGRVQLGAGGDAGAGADGDHRRDQRRPGVRVGARQRPRHRHHAGRPQVRRARSTRTPRFCCGRGRGSRT